MTDRSWSWFKSSYSGGANTECVETAYAGGSAAVRDSKSPGGPLIAVRSTAWADFVGAVRRGDLSPE
ncbi:DUF397 domain-containing protein [Streptomyces sp. NPDC048442]|uniref:DUF397 domain-containing protein n=1 Tax=Streptomyces sp. NPDC048442 TaxID=3154823 RepID=UPI0034237B77